MSTDVIDLTYFYYQDVLTQSESPTTTIASDPDNNSLLLAGFGDGNIKLFDRRLDEGDSVVRVWREHSSRLHSVRWQRGANKELISARYVMSIS